MHIPRKADKDCISELAMNRIVSRLLVMMLTALFAVTVAVAMGFAGAYLYLEPEIPQAAELRDIRLQLPLQVFTRDGKLHSSPLRTTASTSTPVSTGKGCCAPS
jgi:membrane carboxypeptidase/penicillin-binding protein